MRAEDTLRDTLRDTPAEEAAELSRGMVFRSLPRHSYEKAARHAV